LRNISIIIPVYQDREALEKLLLHLQYADTKEHLEIIVVQADESYELSKKVDLKLKVLYAEKACRASQMNLGASEARGEILFFVHADALPPLSLVADIDHAIEKGHLMGGYRLKFDSNALLLNINAYISRFQNMYSGGGDQTLYIPKTIFINNGGYNPSYCIMEDFELVRRLEKEFGYYIIPKEVEVSARKYRYNSYFLVNYTNFKAFQMFKKGIASQVIKEYYYTSLNRVK
jgi:glycosyltransferase involved in cell wall biosynthesis